MLNDDQRTAVSIMGKAIGEACKVPGMTLRDWFAGQALANMAHAAGMEMTAEARAAIFRRRAVQCYEIADAMVAARGE